MNETKTVSKPAKTYRLGNITLAEWAQTSREGEVFHNYTISRNYKDKEDKWKRTQILGYNDILKLRNLLDIIFNEKISAEIVEYRGDKELKVKEEKVQ